MVDAVLLSVSVCTRRPARNTAIAGETPGMNRTVRSPARIGVDESRNRPASRASPAATSAPRLTTFCAVPLTIGRTLIRTVEAVTVPMAISTGRPATVIGAACPRIVMGASTKPALAKPTCFNAERRVSGDMRASYIGSPELDVQKLFQNRSVFDPSCDKIDVHES